MELANRQEVEREFRQQLALSFSDYRQKLEPYISRGVEPPPEIWRQIERDMEDKLAIILLLIFLSSSRSHGYDTAETNAYALQLTQARAKTIAERFTQNSREMLASRKPEQATNQLDGLLDDILGEPRIDRIATTETTVAASAGGEYAALVTGRVSTQDIWYTAADDRVCKICGPLHKKTRDTWRGFFPGGPPAHANCRCFISYEFERIVVK